MCIGIIPILFELTGTTMNMLKIKEKQQQQQQQLRKRNTIMSGDRETCIDGCYVYT